MKLRRVELFASTELNFLEEQMNLWLDNHPDCSVVDVKFSGQGMGVNMELEPMLEIIYSAVIFYEKASA